MAAGLECLTLEDLESMTLEELFTLLLECAVESSPGRYLVVVAQYAVGTSV